MHVLSSACTQYAVHWLNTARHYSLRYVLNAACTQCGMYRTRHVLSAACTEHGMYSVQYVLNTACTQRDLHLADLLNTTCNQYDRHSVRYVLSAACTEHGMYSARPSFSTSNEHDLQSVRQALRTVCTQWGMYWTRHVLSATFIQYIYWTRSAISTTGTSYGMYSVRHVLSAACLSMACTQRGLHSVHVLNTTCSQYETLSTVCTPRGEGTNFVYMYWKSSHLQNAQIHFFSLLFLKTIPPPPPPPSGCHSWSEKMQWRVTMGPPVQSTIHSSPIQPHPHPDPRPFFLPLSPHRNAFVTSYIIAQTTSMEPRGGAGGGRDGGGGGNKGGTWEMIDTHSSLPAGTNAKGINVGGKWMTSRPAHLITSCTGLTPSPPHPTQDILTPSGLRPQDCIDTSRYFPSSRKILCSSAPGFPRHSVRKMTSGPNMTSIWSSRRWTKSKPFQSMCI